MIGNPAIEPGRSSRGPEDGIRQSVLGSPQILDKTGPVNISDQYADLLEVLDERKRAGMVSLLSVNYYEGWRPTRAEVADLVAVQLGVLSIEESIERQRLRSAGSGPVRDITPLIKERYRRYYIHW